MSAFDDWLAVPEDQQDPGRLRRLGAFGSVEKVWLCCTLAIGRAGARFSASERSPELRSMILAREVNDALAKHAPSLQIGARKARDLLPRPGPTTQVTHLNLFVYSWVPSILVHFLWLRPRGPSSLS